MTPDELLSTIKNLINSKKTHPKLLNFVHLRHAVPGDKDELNKAFLKLVKDKKIRVRQGKNNKLIEVCDLK